MHIMDTTNKVGRLLSFVRRGSPVNNMSFFLPVAGLEQLTKLRVVVSGFENLATEYDNEYELLTFSVANINRVQDDFPDVDDTRIWRMDIESLIDAKNEFAEGIASQVIEWRLKYPTHHLPELAPGKIVREADFFNQESIIQQIWALISEGKNLLLAAPRRFGKSSIISRLADHPFEGIKACHIDLEGAASVTEFLRLVLKGLMDKQECQDCLPQAVRERMDSDPLENEKITMIRAEMREIEKDWRKYGDQLFGEMNAADGRLLLMLDEFSWMLEDMLARTGSEVEEVQGFLEWFSHICQKLENVSFIITGSEHLDLFLGAYALSSDFLNDFEQVNLGAFEEGTAQLFSFLALLKQEITVTPTDLKTIVDLAGQSVPYFLQIFLDLLQLECRKAGQIPPEAFKEVYYKKLLGPDAKRYFEYIKHQIERYHRYGINPESVKEILAVLGQEEHIETKELSARWDSKRGGRDFDFLMALLVNDFFVVEKNGLVSMECKIFRDYFKMRLT